MRVLMYGWEYPPRISGGLGVACHAIVQSLIKENMDISLVLPYEMNEINQRGKITPDEKNLQIIHLGDKIFTQKNSDNKIKSYKIDSLLHPYLSPTDYEAILKIKEESLNKNHKKEDESFITNLSKNYSFNNLMATKLTGHYGENLFLEVLRYANIAGEMAKYCQHEIIHAHDWMTIMAGIKAKHLSKKKLIFHIHALELDRSGIDNVNPQIFDIEKYGMEEADKIITVSNYTKNLITKYYNIPGTKIHVVHNGIDSSYSKIENNENNLPHKMVLFVGRITHQKGPSLFIDIAKKILDKRDDVEFVLAGTGNLLKETIEKTASHKIGKNVHFTGFLSPSMVKKIYSLADVYVMPSVSEPFGLSCLEALALNVPVVLSKQSGVSEVLNHALLADFWDVNEMAAKILALLDYKALRNESLKNAKEQMKDLTWEKAGNKIVNLYKELKTTYNF